MNYLDTHFHLDLWQSPPELLKDIEKKRIYTIAVTNTPSVFEYTYRLTRSSKYVRAALGLHPELVAERYSELPLFEKLIHETKYIGEVGLDYSSSTLSNRNLQRSVFEKIVATCALKGDRVLTVHSRKAEGDVIGIIGNEFPGRVILHWYSGNLTNLRKAVEYGFFFSVNEAMLQSKAGRRILSEIPLERILTESDGPFVKSVNGVSSSPLFIERTVESLAGHMNFGYTQMKQIVYSNFKGLLEPVSDTVDIQKLIDFTPKKPPIF